MKYIVDEIDEMKDLAIKISDLMETGDVFGLIGDLGAGKTTLVSLILEYLGYPEVVSSPSFSLANIYNSQPRINHLDLYRLETQEEIESFEYEEYFYPDDSISFIEWPLKAESYLPRDIMYIKIEIEDSKRIVEIDNKLIERNDDKWRF